MKEKIDKKQKAGLSHIAEAAGVSRMTVSRVLREKEGFSEATRVKVMREVEKSGYLPNRLATTFSQADASTLVGVCVPRLSSHFFGLVLESVNRTFQRLGYQTIVGTHNQSLTEEELWLKNILEWRPCGVLLSSNQHSPGTLKLLKDSGTPVVEFWNLNNTPKDFSVGFNEYTCGVEMAQHAISRGYRRAALLGSAMDWEAGRLARFKGFTDYFENGDGEVVLTEKLNDTPGFYSGYYGTENLLNQSVEIDMIYFQDDTMALGGLSWCQRQGIPVPDQIGIAGWGNHEAASIYTDRLTTTSVPMRKIGKLAAEIMVSQLQQETVKKINVVPTTLIDGQTL